MESNQLLSPPSIVVRRIKVLSFWMDENDIPLDIIFKVDLNQKFSVSVQDRLAATELRVWYSMPVNENEFRTVFDCRVQNIFEITEIEKYSYLDGKVSLPNELLINITSMSITHARAVTALYAAGTLFAETLIPVVNPVDATMAFFKTEAIDKLLFKQEDKLKQENIQISTKRSNKKVRT